MPQVLMEVPVDLESLADQEHQDCPEKRVSQVAMESLDQQESKESLVCQVMVAQGLLDSQVSQVLREIPVCRARLAVLVSPDLKERLGSLASLVLLDQLAHLDHQDKHCLDLKAYKDPQDHPAEEDNLVHKVLEDLQEVVASKERRVFLELQGSQDTLDRREKPVPLDSLVLQDFLVDLVLREMLAFLVFLVSQEPKETLEPQESVVFQVILETLDLRAHLDYRVHRQSPLW